METTLNVIDLHCDTIYEAFKRDVAITDPGLVAGLSARPPEMRLCQCMAIFMPDEYRGLEAEEYFGAVYQYCVRQRQQHRAELIPVLELDKIGQALEEIPMAIILTVEGGSALGGKLENVRKLHKLGVRMMTLTWNGANELAGGMKTNKGLTAFGRKAVREMENQGIVIDISHLSDKAFSELADFAQRPFVASHSNARAVCAHPRNLTDGMFKEIRDRHGLVGMNYYKNFIADDGKTTSLDDLLRHIHHFLDLGGEDVIALGSDFDGAELPPYLDSMEKVLYIFDAMERSGIPTKIVEKIRYGNARRFFENYAG